MTELFSCVYITNMHFYYGATEAAYAVVEGDAGVGVGAGIEHYAIVCEAYFLHFVYQFALDVALIIFQFDVGKALFEPQLIHVFMAACSYFTSARIVADTVAAS